MGHIHAVCVRPLCASRAVAIDVILADPRLDIIGDSTLPCLIAAEQILQGERRIKRSERLAIRLV